MLTAGLTAVVMSACTLEHQSEQVRLCNVVEPNGWTFDKDRPLDATLVRGSSTYRFELFDTGSKDDIHGSVPRAYWIQVTGLTFGAADPALRKAMVYDPAGAVLAINDQRVQALPRLWHSEQVNGTNQPVTEISAPTDLDVHYQGLVGDFFVAFPIPAPRPKDTYTFRPGSILLDGSLQALPTFASCYEPSRTWWQPIH